MAVYATPQSCSDHRFLLAGSLAIRRNRNSTRPLFFVKHRGLPVAHSSFGAHLLLVCSLAMCRIFSAKRSDLPKKYLRTFLQITSLATRERSETVPRILYQQRRNPHLLQRLVSSITWRRKPWVSLNTSFLHLPVRVQICQEGSSGASTILRGIDEKYKRALCHIQGDSEL